MRVHVLMFAGLFALCLVAHGAESKSLKKASLAATEELFSDIKVLDVSVEVPPEQLEALKKEPRVYVKATVKEGSAAFPNTGFRFKGTNANKSGRPSFTLKFNEFITDQRFYGQRKLGFESSEHDATYVTEAVANELFRTAGIPAPRNTFARVHLNGKDVGLYVVSEGVNKDFLDKHFGKSKGNLYEGDGTDVTEKMDKDSGDDAKEQPDLKAIADSARDANLEQRWKKLQTLVDVDRFLSFVGLEVLTWHTNGYALNKGRFRIYNDPETKLMVFMPHGIDVAFSRPDAPLKPELKGLLARAILETPEGKKRYQATMANLLTKVFKVDLTQARIKELAGKIKPAMKDKDAHTKAVNDLLERVAARHKFAQQELKI
jgi:spore coat protein H